MNSPVIDSASYWVAAFTFIVGMILFYNDTQLFWGGFSAALIAAGLSWISYVLVRWLILAFK